MRWAIEENLSEQGPSSHTLVLVHGAVANLRAWDGFLEALDRAGERDLAESCRSIRTVTVDLPCHGRSEGGALDFELSAEGIVAIADSLGLELPVLVGHI